MTPPPRRALVLEDGHSPFVLAGVRALGRAGWEVGLGGPRPSSRVARSRWVRHRHAVPSPQDGLAQFARAVSEAVSSGGYSIVFCGEDAEVLALLSVRDRIGAVAPWGELAAVLAAIDKLGLVRAARRAGIDAPDTVEASPEALAAVALPVVVKPRLHWTPDGGGTNRDVPVTLCATRAQAASLVEQITAGGGHPLLQEPVSGDLMAQTVVLDRSGRVRGVVQQRSSRISLRATSTRARTEPVDEELLDGVRQMLVELGWVGIANLQFLQPPGGRPHLIDLNGRFYGSLGLAVRAGVNLPALWAEAALDMPSGPRVTAPPGVRFSALEEDLRRARRHREGGLARDAGSSLLAAIGAAHVTWDVTDPLPALVTAAGIARSAAGKLVRAAR